MITLKPDALTKPSYMSFYLFFRNAMKLVPTTIYVYQFFFLFLRGY